MAALIVEIADAVVTALKAAEFGMEIPWERSYGDWDLELKEIGCVRGDVVPVFDAQVELETRGSVRYELNIDIALRKRFSSQTDIDCGRINRDEIDKLLYVVQRMQQQFVATRPSDDSVWSPSRTQQVQAWYVKAHLREWNQFTGVVRLPYESSLEL
jgi:hypothetical protein